MPTGIGIVPVGRPTFDNTNHAILTEVLQVKDHPIHASLTKAPADIIGVIGYNADRGRYSPCW